MKLNIATDFAIRTLLYIALQEKKAESPAYVHNDDIALHMGISASYQPQISRKLKNGGLLKASKGQKGGLRLAKDPADISILDVIVCMEGKMAINRCLEEDRYCSRYATENCPVRALYCSVQEKMEQMLASETIQTMLDRL